MMTCNYTSFSTAFQSYQDEERLIMKAVCNGTPLPVERNSLGARLELEAARSADQRCRASFLKRITLKPLQIFNLEGHTVKSRY